jgi:hypothetical protein
MFGSRKKRIQALNDMLADAPNIYNSFDANKDFSFDAIRDIIKEYNSFVAPANDHFITVKGETVKCKIVKLLADSIRKNRFSYRTTDAGNFVHLDLETVKEYTYKDSTYAKMKLPADTVLHFTYWAMQGKINLYEYNDPKLGKSLFANKSDGPIIAVWSKKGPKDARKTKADDFQTLIADFPDLLDQFKNTNDSSADVIALTVKTYNKLKK